jgi:hypothetical protein
MLDILLGAVLEQIQLEMPSLSAAVTAIYYPPSPTRIPLNRMQSPSTLDIVLSNGLHKLDYLSTRTELSSDHLPVLFEVTSDSRREVPNHYIFNYKHADWNQFKLILDSRIHSNSFPTEAMYFVYGFPTCEVP